MTFTPQRYKIADEIGTPFIDEAEIFNFLTATHTDTDVQSAIDDAMNKKRLTLAQTAALLNANDRKPILDAAKKLKRNVYGNRIVLFAPLYVGNLCANGCDYCAFAKNNTQTVRKTLSDNELSLEIDALAAQGHKRLILVYGEHPKYDAQFIAENVRQVYATGKIRRVNINAAPMTVDDFATIHQAGIGTYQIFQETYNRAVYESHHLSGRKANYDWRITALDRAMQGGIDDVGLGALLGLHKDWRFEILSLIRHTNHLEACFNVGPHTISFPRITEALGANGTQFPINDDDFIFAIAVLRLAVPYTGLILTARESESIRSQAIDYGVSQIDGGTKLRIGAYANESEQGEAQFAINDNRSLADIIEQLIATDKIPSFCTACYRKGRTGEHFMEFSTSGFIKRFCTPNAILTLVEYLEDYASPALKANGYALIEKELAAMASPSSVIERIELIKNGQRDIYF